MRVVAYPRGRWRQLVVCRRWVVSVDLRRCARGLRWILLVLRHQRLDHPQHHSFGATHGYGVAHIRFLDCCGVAFVRVLFILDGLYTNQHRFNLSMDCVSIDIGFFLVATLLNGLYSSRHRFFSFFFFLRVWYFQNRSVFKNHCL